jgi:hypothetical protein
MLDAASSQTMWSQGQHELFMVAISAVIGVVVGIIAGRIWQRWQDMREWRGFSEAFTEEELGLINAHRVRREREGDPKGTIRKVQ